MPRPLKYSRVSRWKQNLTWIVGGVAVLAACVAIRQIGGAPSAKAQAPATKATAVQPVDRGVKAAAQPGKPPQPFVASVNGERISRDELAKQCLRHFGEEVIEALVNRRLVSAECERQGVQISPQQVDAEIDRLARKFALPKQQYLKMLEKERGVRPAQYGEMVWLTLALRELAKDQLSVSRAELDQAFESQFGAAVKARLIVIKNQAKARQIHAQATAHPEQFGTLAREHSEDVPSASMNGLVQPIRRHLGDPQIEEAAFKLKLGEVSPLVKVGEQYVLLKCEGQVEPSKVDRQTYEPTLREALAERKLRKAGAEVFKRIQDRARIENIWNDPERRAAQPGVAALVNGQPIAIAELSHECVERYGAAMLEGTIHRRLIEQAIKRRNLTVGDAELREELSRAALTVGKTNKAGQPDVEGLLEEITRQQGVSREVYLHDSVWPAAALRKLVEGDKSTQVTDDDIRKGIESNYGKRVRCRAIVLPNQRKAQEVWEKARRARDVEEFGDLAEKYSIETTSKHLKGEVPPLQRHGGEPALEKAAFELQPGQISGIVQVAETWVILFCEGFTEPVKVKPEEARQLVLEDVRAKKLRLAMQRQFEQLKSSAYIDNYLSGEARSPKKAGEQTATAAGAPAAAAAAKRTK